jgi:hypothetical protein
MITDGESPAVTLTDGYVLSLLRLPGETEWRIRGIESPPLVRAASGELVTDNVMASWFRGDMRRLEWYSGLPAHWADMRFDSAAEAVSFAEAALSE